MNDIIQALQSAGYGITDEIHGFIRMGYRIITFADSILIADHSGQNLIDHPINRKYLGVSARYLSNPQVMRDIIQKSKKFRIQLYLAY